MLDPTRNKENLKAYRNGFGAGAFVGIVVCIIVAKPIYILPLVLGHLFGTVAFEHKNTQDGKR